MSGASIIVGGGIAGLVAALLLAERQGRETVVIEREAEVGGLLRSFDYGEHGKFDYGMHNMYETGIADLDALLFGLLEPGDWHLLEGNARDLAGVYVFGGLQSHSPYVDIRRLPKEAFDACLAGFFRNLDAGEQVDLSSAPAYARSRYGDPIAEQVVLPVVRKLFKREPEAMDAMGAMITNMDRILLFNQPLMLDLMNSPFLRTRLGFPDQRVLPPEFASGRKGYYPKHYGMYRVIDALKARLAKAGARILTGAQVARVEHGGGRVKSVAGTAEGKPFALEVERLCWTSGLPPLAATLGMNLSALPFDKPLRTVVVNMLIDRPLDIGDLYYFYCYDNGFDTFRVTNYAGYCPLAGRDGGIPICVELLRPDEGLPDKAALERQAADELARFGVLAPGTRILFSRAEPLVSGFPMPTLKNTGSLGAIRGWVDGLGLSNLVPLGILSRERLFFQRDVLVHVYESLNKGASA